MKDKLNEIEERVKNLERQMNSMLKGSKVSSKSGVALNIQKSKIQKMDFKNNYDKALMCAYFMLENNDMEEFTSKDMANCMKELRIYAPANLTDYLSKGSGDMRKYFIKLEREKNIQSYALSAEGISVAKQLIEDEEK